VDEARAVLRRLRRIERLERERAPADSVLGEVRELLAEAEAWLVAEAGADCEAAAAALGRCRARLADPVRR
jgi:hypothetical protein